MDSQEQHNQQNQKQLLNTAATSAASLQKQTSQTEPFSEHQVRHLNEEGSEEKKVKENRVKRPRNKNNNSTGMVIDSLTPIESTPKGEAEGGVLEKGFYEVEKVLDKRLFKGKVEYFVKWKNFPETENSWVPCRSFTNCEENIRKFQNRSSFGGRRGRKRKENPHAVPIYQHAETFSPQENPNIPQDDYSDPKGSFSDVSRRKRLIPSLHNDGNGSLSACQLNTMVNVIVSRQETVAKKDRVGAKHQADSGVVQSSDAKLSNRERSLEKDFIATVPAESEPTLRSIINQIKPTIAETVDRKLRLIQSQNRTEENDLVHDPANQREGVGRALYEPSSQHKICETLHVQGQDIEGQDKNCEPLQDHSSSKVKSVRGKQVLDEKLHPEEWKKQKNTGADVTNQSCENSSSPYVHITRIHKAVNYIKGTFDGKQDIRVTFKAQSADGNEVIVDNKYLRLNYPTLLLDFYEQHLHYNN